MNKHIFFSLIFVAIFSSSCTKTFVQTFATQSSSISKKNGNWEFENDTLKITYDFNGNYGKMAFTVFNKLNKPLYIDWKNSAFIFNGLKNNYWVEETTTLSNSMILTNKTMPLPVSLAKSNTQSVKTERVTFIPPKSGISSLNSSITFKLTNVRQHYIVNTKKATKIFLPDLWRKNKQLEGYELNYSENESIIKFRNFIAFSFSENSSQFNYIDNSFYVNNLKEIDVRCFDGTKFVDKTSFFIENIDDYVR